MSRDTFGFISEQRIRESCRKRHKKLHCSKKKQAKKNNDPSSVEKKKKIQNPFSALGSKDITVIFQIQISLIFLCVTSIPVTIRPGSHTWIMQPQTLQRELNRQMQKNPVVARMLSSAGGESQHETEEAVSVHMCVTQRVFKRTVSSYEHY